MAVTSLWRRWDDGITWRDELVTGPTFEPIDLGYMKGQVLRVVNGQQDDEFILNQITAARQLFEVETGRAAGEQTRRLTLSGFPSSVNVRPVYAIELPMPPLIAVLSVQYLDDAGVTQTLSGSPADYTVLPSGTYTPGRITPLVGATWPTLSAAQEDAVIITYTAGYATADEFPALYKAGMGLLVAELYESRGLSDERASKAVLDTSRFWRPFR